MYASILILILVQPSPQVIPGSSQTAPEDTLDASAYYTENGRAPISLKVDILSLSGSRFFLTAGLSSYVMLNETYQFHYSGYNSDPDLLQSWSDRTGTGHWMSNAGLSVGYELDIHPNWSLRAEPFIRIPVKDVGWGQVRLYSVGSFISLRYRFPS